MRKEPRLHFTKEEREDPALEKTIRRTDRAAARADKAQAAIPKKKVRERAVDPDTGAVTVHLRFEDKNKPPSKLTHTLRDAPSGTVLGLVHREIGEAQEDNVGVEAAHKSEQAAEAAGRLVREGYHSHKLRPYRKAAAAERRLEKANINALYQKSLRENPQLANNPVSRWRQKQAIKGQYAAARRAGQAGTATGQAAAQTARSAKAAAKKSKQTADFVRRHKKGFLAAGGLLLAVAFFLNCMSSCSVLFSGVGSGVAGSTYPSTDEAMLGAEAAYAGMEAELQAYL
ncbi:MAG TPA: CHAP domain-containing protein, partial [Candidatus Oscillibacter excrementavium]|nr:CHAP domain-containing protein [Candidatus Oscillibacter excrementavium]